MSAPVLLQPLPQFCDANGKPYAGGLIFTYVKGTTAPKTTWKDPGQAAVNTNPITLDAAGQCSMWGDGDYQLELHDAAGNLIWSQPSTTVVSAAMYPAVSAPTVADALIYLGVTSAISDAVAAEATIRANADITIQTNLDAFVTAQENYNSLAAVTVTDLANYVQIEDANLQAQINTIAGAPVVNMQGAQASITIAAGASSAVLTLTFPRAFANACDAIVVTSSDSAIGGTPAIMSFSAVPLSATQATIVAILPAPLSPIIVAWTAHFNYIAIGH